MVYISARLVSWSSSLHAHTNSCTSKTEAEISSQDNGYLNQFKKLWLWPSVQPWLSVFILGTALRHRTVPTCSGLVFVINIWAIDECSYKNANYYGFLIVLQPYQMHKPLTVKWVYLILGIYQYIQIYLCNWYFYVPVLVTFGCKKLIETIYIWNQCISRTKRVLTWIGLTVQK